MPRKGWIATAAEAVQEVAEPVLESVKAIVAKAMPAPSGDPWYRDDERRAEVNAEAEAERDAARGDRWIPSRRDWLDRNP